MLEIIFRLQSTNLAHSGRRKNCKKNPWCLYGLGEGKEGIWNEQHTKNVLEEKLGKDPSTHLRSQSKRDDSMSFGLSPPAGLQNQGATCYLNALMQVRTNACIKQYHWISFSYSLLYIFPLLGIISQLTCKRLYP